ncbi:MAG: helix-turn-helix transcriptional regulator [bacterium]|nr:helix-turn-helix transcriptional regulator [bacterium]
MNLDEKIKKIRKDNKMSQDDIAEILNVTRQTISNWENGKNYPDIETLIKISDKFNISLDILLKENMNMVKEMDKNVKDTKKYKTILKVIMSILIFLIVIFIIYNFMYFNSKDRLESKFNETIEKYNFSINRDGYYSMIYSDNIIFSVPNQKMPKLLEFNLDFYAKHLYCDTDNEINHIKIIWSEYNNFSASITNQETKKTIYIDFSKDDFNNYEKLSDELKYDKNLLKEIIIKGNNLYKEFYK